MARNERAQWAQLDIDGVALLADLAGGVSLARAIDFTSPALRAFGATAPIRTAMQAGTFNGSVAQGASCNCSVLTLTPHANGTHTECAAHLTVEPLDAYRVIPLRLLPAVLLSVQPERAADSEESSTPPPAAEDRLVTRAALARAWPRALSLRLSARAAVIRTLPNDRAKFVDSDTARTASSAAPFFSEQAAMELVERGIGHVVLDLPSIDRAEDGGALRAHRIFFGLPPRVTALAEARRRDCTITELAYVDDSVADGWYLLGLQAPAIAGDAVPSRPLLYPLRLA